MRSNFDKLGYHRLDYAVFNLHYHMNLYHNMMKNMLYRPHSMKTCVPNNEETYVICRDNFRLLDGDRIATLLAGYIAELLKAADATHLQIGLVQTAYANGASTKYITEQLVFIPFNTGTSSWYKFFI
jgi:hypothetical protein